MQYDFHQNDPPWLECVGCNMNLALFTKMIRILNFPTKSIGCSMYSAFFTKMIGILNFPCENIGFSINKSFYQND